MSNKNYSKMYKPNNAAPQEVADEIVTEDVIDVVEAPEVIETPVEPVATVEPEVIEVVEVPEVQDAEPEKVVKTVSAVVVNCAKLNVREEPSPAAKVVAVIDASAEVLVCDINGFGNYYKVCTASGVEGYCVKDFLNLK